MTELKNYKFALFIISVIIFAAGVVLKLHSPLVEWDHLSILQAVSWAKGGKFFVQDHPPLYPFLLSFFSGPADQVAYFRCFNLLGVALTGVLLYGFCRKYMERGLSLAAAAFYLLTPAVIQGTTVLDFADTSWLPLAFLLLFRLAASLSAKFSVAGWLALAAAAVLCLSFKITSTAALFAAFTIGWLLAGKALKRSFLPVLAALASGALVFYAGWRAAAPHLFPAGVSPHIFAIARETVFLRASSAFTPEYAAKWLVYLAAVFFWFSPFILCLLAVPFLKVRGFVRKDLPAELRLLAFAGLFYFIGYFLVGGLNHGFPRYQLAVWPLLVFFAVYGCREALLVFLEKYVLATTAAAGLAALPGLIFLPDPLRLLNLGLKEALLNGSGLGTVAAGLAAVALYYLVLGWAWTRRGNNTAFTSLMAAAIAFYAVTDLTQMKAGYATSYEYGAAGKAELAAALGTSGGPGARIFATPGLLYYLRPGENPGFSSGNWGSTWAIRTVILGTLPDAVVLGAVNNTLWQLRLFRSDPELVSALNTFYVRENVGTFSVWKKRAPLGEILAGRRANGKL